MHSKIVDVFLKDDVASYEFAWSLLFDQDFVDRAEARMNNDTVPSR